MPRFSYPSDFVSELEALFPTEETFLKDLEAGAIFCVEKFLQEQAPDTHYNKALELFRDWYEKPDRHREVVMGT